MTAHDDLGRGDFEQELRAWIDDELAGERAARVEETVRTSPELMARVSAERAVDARVKRALLADAADSRDLVRSMVARARLAHPAPVPQVQPAGRVLRRTPWAALRAVAAVLVLSVGGMWWFCIPPFECAYMQALEAAARDPAAAPCPKAEAFCKRCGIPERAAELVAAKPAGATETAVHGVNLAGIRQDFVRGSDATAVCVVVFESKGVRPSVRRRVERDGQDWWIADVAGRRVVAFDHGDDVCAVTGPTGDESVYSAAKTLRASFK